MASPNLKQRNRVGSVQRQHRNGRPTQVSEQVAGESGRWAGGDHSVSELDELSQGLADRSAVVIAGVQVPFAAG